MAAKKGDTVRIKARGIVREGIALSVQTFSDGTTYIEYRDPMYGYGYWKQDLDGGEYEVIVSAPAEPTFEEQIKALRDECKSVIELVDKITVRFKGSNLEIKGSGPFSDPSCPYECYSWDMRVSYAPPVTLYLFLLASDDRKHINALMLVGEEATEMDRLLSETPAWVI